VTVAGIPESIVHLGLVTGALVMVPLCRRWIGGPLWIYLTSACGMVILIVAQLRQIWLALQMAEDTGAILWVNTYVQGAGAFLALAGFALWARHVQRSKLELSHIATTDPLTHLANRRHVGHLLQHEVVRARRTGATLSVLAIDVDRLKPVNDGYGHLAGDALLKHMARLMKGRLREIDTIARVGGDEFFAILPDTPASAALQVAIELRQIFYDSPAEYGGLEIPVRASFGVAELKPGRELSPEVLAARADEALYAVKRLGGNGVADWTSLQAEPGGAPTPTAMALAARPN
jgi:diguanylate cyclase (GGDEF)-like protein